MARVKQSGNGLVYLTRMQVKLLNKGRMVHIQRASLNLKLKMFTSTAEVRSLKARIDALQSKLKKMEVGI